MAQQKIAARQILAAAAVGFAVLLSLATVSMGQSSCTAVAFLGQIGGTSCTGQELGDAMQNGPGTSPCEEVPNASCILTENSVGICDVFLYDDLSCNGNLLAIVGCGGPSQNVNFGSMEVTC